MEETSAPEDIVHDVKNDISADEGDVVDLTVDQAQACRYRLAVCDHQCMVMHRTNYIVHLQVLVYSCAHC